MNKKTILNGFTCIALALSCTAMTSCQGAKTSQHEAPATSSSTEKISIAYVQMDSVTANYTFAKEIQASLEGDAKDNRATLESKAGAFQKAAQDYQRRVQINAFVSQDAALAEQKKVLKMQQEAQNLELQMTQKFALKQQMMMQDLAKDVKEKLKEFNNGRFQLILSNTGMDNVLYADDALDITKDFINFLNDNYKGKASKEEKK